MSSPSKSNRTFQDVLSEYDEILREDGHMAARRPQIREYESERGTEVRDRSKYEEMEKLKAKLDIEERRGMKASPDRDIDMSDSVETELRRLSEYLDELHGVIESHSQVIRPILGSQEVNKPSMDGFATSESYSQVRNRIMQSTNIVINAIEKIRSLTHDVDL